MCTIRTQSTRSVSPRRCRSLERSLRCGAGEVTRAFPEAEMVQAMGPASCRGLAPCRTDHAPERGQPGSSTRCRFVPASSCPRRPGAVGPGLPPSPRQPAASCPPSSTRGEPAMRAALYARVSTERQERFQTIDSQLAALRDWAATGEHEISDDFVFRDEGYSGSRLDRPGLDALRDAVRDGVVGIVAVLTPDRLART